MDTNREVQVTDEHIKLFKSLKFLQGYKDELDYEGLTLHRALVKIRKEYEDRLNPTASNYLFLYFPIVIYFFDFNSFTGTSYGDILLFFTIGLAPPLTLALYYENRKRRKAIDKLEKDNVPQSVLNNLLIPESLYSLIFRLKNFDEIYPGKGLSSTVKKELQRTIRKDYFFHLIFPMVAIFKTLLAESDSNLLITHWLTLIYSLICLTFFTLQFITRYRLIATPNLKIP